MKNIILSLTLAVSMLFGSGCASIGLGTAKDPIPAIKTAAYVGSFYALREHPEWRSGFETALAELKVLENSDTLDWVSLMAIVNRLPVDELKSDDATVIITAGTMLLSQYGEGVLDVDSLEKIKPVAAALREGIELALIPPPAP